MQHNDENLQVCTECGHDEFQEQRNIQFHKNIRSREEYEMHMPITPIRIRLVYHCTKCGHALDK